MVHEALDNGTRFSGTGGGAAPRGGCGAGPGAGSRGTVHLLMGEGAHELRV